MLLCQSPLSSPNGRLRRTFSALPVRAVTVKPRRSLWGWSVAVLALHLLVLSALPSHAPAPLIAPAMAQTFTTRTVPALAPEVVPAAVQAAAPTAAKPVVPSSAVRKTPAAREKPRRPPVRALPVAEAAAPSAEPRPTPDASGPSEAPPLDSNALLALSADGAALAQEQPSLPDETVQVASAGTDTAPASPAAEDQAGTTATAPPSAPAAEEEAPAPAAPSVTAPALGSALAIFAPGSDQPRSGPAPAVQVPAPQRLSFDVTGQAKKFQYSARAELVWQHDGQRYQARQEISILLLGARTQSSTGTLGPTGLQPQRFGDRARSEKAAHFDYTQHRVTFSANTPDAPLAAGTQDRLSVFVQLGALLAAAPERYPTGTRIRLDTAGTSDVDPWTFSVEGEETLELPVGSVRTLRLQRLPRPGHEYDQKAQVWLAPTLGYLPARIRLTQANGDFADLRLTGHTAPL